MLTTAAAAGFYEATAQVLPIFLLVMLVGEARLGSMSSRQSPLWVRLAIYLLNAGVIIAGEVAALIATGSGETLVLHVLVCGAVAAGCAYLMSRFLWTILDESKDELSEAAQARQTRLLIAVSVAVIVAVYFALVLSTR
jgi:hypothetical protein